MCVPYPFVFSVTGKKVLPPILVPQAQCDRPTDRPSIHPSIHLSRNVEHARPSVQPYRQNSSGIERIKCLHQQKGPHKALSSNVKDFRSA